MIDHQGQPVTSPPRNLGISRQLAFVILGMGVILAIAGVAIGILAFGLDEQSTPIMTTLLVGLGTTLGTAITALKATEAADTASRAKNISELSASQSAALRQEVRGHIAQVCPRDDCPLRTEGVLNHP